MAAPSSFVSLALLSLVHFLPAEHSSVPKALPKPDVLALSAPADSVESSIKKRGTAAVGYRIQSFPGNREAAWTTYVAALRYQARPGTFGVEYRHLSRFDRQDEALVLDAYPALWEAAYAHLRYQHTFDAEAYADDDVLVQIFQPLGGGWVPFLTYRHRAYADGPVQKVNVVGAGTDKYVGHWLLRGRAELIIVGDRPGSFGRITARRFLKAGTHAPADTYLEAHLGAGEETVISGVAPVRFDAGTSYSASLGGQFFFTPTWGTSAAVTLVNSAALPTRVGLSLRLKARW